MPNKSVLLRAASASLLFLCLACPRVSAQVGEPRRAIAIGASAGVSLNQIGFDPTIKQNWHTAPTFGLTARIMSERWFKTYCALQMELNYAQLGWDENVLNSHSEELPDTYRRHLDYVQVPFLARLGWGREARGLMGYIVLGPQVGYLIGESTSRSQTWTLDTEGNPDRPNGLFAQYDMPVKHKFDYGITGGAGLEVNTAAGHFMLDARYYYGLADIYGNAKRDVFARSNHGTITVKLSYLFDVRKERR